MNSKDQFLVQDHLLLLKIKRPTKNVLHRWQSFLIEPFLCIRGFFFKNSFEALGNAKVGENIEGLWNPETIWVRMEFTILSVHENIMRGIPEEE